MGEDLSLDTSLLGIDFEIIVKPGCLNVGPDQLSHIDIGEETTNIGDGLPDVQLFQVDIADDHYASII